MRGLLYTSNKHLNVYKSGKKYRFSKFSWKVHLHR